MDRNFLWGVTDMNVLSSLSARRAWIEIDDSLDSILAGVVALRKESVDRNRCWVLSNEDHPHVALRKESVDRNSTYVIRLPRCQGRSPQGERG